MTVEGAPLKIVRLFAEGESVGDLATRFGIDEDRVRRILRAAGCDVREEATAA